jgi:hypothetical protein
MEEFLRNFGLTLLAVMAVAGILALFLLLIIIVAFRRIEVPPGADFFETMLYTPLVVVLFLDLLDLALDIFSAPLAWVVLDQLGLKALRNIAAFEAFVPFTQMLPTMTAAWVAARVMGRDRFRKIKYFDTKTRN